MKNPVQKNPQRTSWQNAFLLVTRTILFGILILFLFLSMPQSILAANGINRVINFQGKLMNKSDSTNISNGTYSFTFKLYDAASSGNLLWSETQGSVTLTNGIFQVNLGSSTAFNAGGYNVNFNQNNLYLDITFNGETFGSRIQLATVPYAVNSEQLDGVIATQSASSFTLTGGLSTPQTLTVNGNITIGSTITPTNGGGLTVQSNGANGLTLDTGSQATVSIGTAQANAIQFGNTAQNTAFTFNGAGLTTLAGRVSIGTTGTSATLTTQALSGILPIASFSGSTSFAGLVVDNSGKGDLFTASSSGLNRFVVTQAGNVGIGTTTPGSGLTIKYTWGATSPLLIQQVVAGTTFNNLVITNNGQFTYNPLSGFGGSSAIQFGTNDSYSSTNYFVIDPSINNTGNLLNIEKANVSKALFDTNGDLVIGASTALGTLDVRSQNGTLPIASISGQTSFAGLIVDNSGIGDLFTASSSGLTRFRIGNTGNVVFQGDTITSIGTGGTANTSGAVIYAVGDQGSLIPNAGFESAATGVGFADGWAVAATDSAAVFRVATDSAKGVGSVWIKLNNNSAAFYSTCIPLAGQNAVGQYTLNYYIGNSSGTVAQAASFLDWYATSANCETGTSPTFVSTVKVAPASGTWITLGSGTTAITNPTGNPKWGRVHFYITCAAGCTNSITHIDGVRLTEKDGGQGVDYAENYPADPNNIPQPGAVVSLSSDSNGIAQVIPANKPMDESVIGVVSTNPGYVLDDGSMKDPKVPVALAGRIPTNVSTKNGVIHLGDYLTSSEISGVAVKATKAGQVIGIAMEDDTDINPADVHQVTMFVKNTYFAGNSSQDISDALVALGTLVQQSESTSTMALSITNTDRIIAGLDVITPKLVAESVLVNNIQPATGSAISFILPDGGSIVVTNTTHNAVIKFDSQGNGFFAGTLTADTIQANHIKGLDIITNQLTQLHSQVASLSANMTVLGTDTFATPSASDLIATESAVNFQSLSVGLATVSGNLRVKNNGLFEGMLSVIDTLSANNLIVNGISDFFNNVIFHGDVHFTKHPTFSTDTAGTVVVPQGQDHISVAFSHAYDNTPVITANIINYNNNLTSQAILTAGYGYIITNASPSGFTIQLSKTAQQSISFTWISVAVDPGIILIPTPTPILQSDNSYSASGSATP